MSTIHLQVASRVTPDNPRGARAAAALFVATWRLVAGLFRAAPAAPAQSVEEEARAVREMAWQYQKVDPRFAADLMAAADRHERING
jgi:hypothetical protein